jgi:hypothetical protein
MQKELKVELIKKLRLKKGCEYIIFFPISCGLSPSEIEEIDTEFMRLGIMMHSTKGIKIVENEGI